jgi:lipopolysaccharide export system protein LptA
LLIEGSQTLFNQKSEIENQQFHDSPMSWQKKARLAIAVFVIVFVAIVFIALRQRKSAPVAGAIPERRDKDCILENTTGGHAEQTKEGRVVFGIRFGAQCVYADGRSKLGNGVEITSNRNGKPFTVTSREADIVQADNELKSAHFRTAVKLTSEGTEVTADDATYNQTEGILRAPGAVAFRRGRMQGTGVGATYDLNREVLWLLDRAHITVAADDKGQGRLDATAGAAGMARADHYVKLTRNGHIDAEGRVIDADEITILLTQDDQRVQTLQLRGNSRITGSGDSSGPQAMSARDIDLTYGEDGRTLQHSQLVENAVVDLPGEGKSGGRRIVGKTIDIAMSPDGKTVTNLNATENVQVDLPPEGDAPAKRIRSATLAASGAPGSGLQNATFGGGVEYRETRAAHGNVAAVDRFARSLTLIVATKPGFGAVEQADFHGNVHFTDGPEVVADATRALYHVDRDQIDLSPSNDPGPASPRVSDGRVTVEARAIEFSLGTRKLKADTKIRSSMQPQHKSDAKSAGAATPPAGARRGTTPAPPAAGTDSQARIPSLLKEDQPVTITSNRLEYDGAAGHAVYTGNARLWQADTKVNGDTIIVDDKTGNLEARIKVHTEMTLDDVDPKTKARKATRSIGDSDAFFYDDAKRLATYTGNAHLVGAEGDVTAEKLELFLVQGANELERAEGYGANGAVIVKESGRVATGARLTYTAKDERYLMTRTPVEAVENSPSDCKKSVGAVLTFQRSVDTVKMTGNELIRSVQTPITCPAGTR